MRVTLLGTGDTAGTPRPGCDCDTCLAARERGVERTRSSVHVRNESTGDVLLIDASPDFRQQFLREDVALPDAAVITHIHFDHLDGLGNVYRLLDHLPVYAANETDPKTNESVAGTIRRKYDYLETVSVQSRTPHESFRVCGFDVTLVPVDHPPLLTYGVVVEEPETGATLALSGDTSYRVPAASRDALRDADLLLADGIVPASLCDYHPLGGRDEDETGTPRTFGTKHMTREGAVSLADDLNAAELRVVHVAHRYPPNEAFAAPLAVDGETFSL
ncbi:MBL fold metallo-hydrolase [Halarchaeum nitratireducens]|uniref:ATP-binding protein n=1 Tax=Halarchaeum nitratireducens TaxID=489913 RepID=A0A830GBE5_9EURY|nr:MBL fold metallo-hydrolase [Halarchaeum nitratireducens]GGN12716.1 ATP-binding protein [Halarchaeum nitratireducens]